MIPSLLQIPSAVSDSKLHSVLPNNGKGDFQFERSTGATRINQDGLIEEVGYFSSELVQNGNFSELGSEALINGDFATDSDWSKGTGWVIINGYAESDGTNAPLDQVSRLTIGKTYKVVITVTNMTSSALSVRLGTSSSDAVLSILENGTYTAYGVAGATTLRLRSQGFDGRIQNVSVKQVDPNDRWTLGIGWSYGDGVVSCDGSQTTWSILGQNNILPQNGSTVKITFTISNYSAGNIYPKAGFNDPSIAINGNGTYTVVRVVNGYQEFRLQADLNFIGTIDNVSVVEVQGDRPRLSYDITNGVVEDKPHLLLENSSTNLVTFSNDFSQWVVDGQASISSDSIISPDGTKNSDKLIAGTTSARQSIKLSSTNSGDLSFSIFAKKGEYSVIQLTDAQNGSAFANFNLETGAVGSTSVYTASMVNMGNDWYRCIITWNASVGIVAVRVGIVTTPTSARVEQFAGNGSDGLYIYGAQLEQQTYATSYIKTAGTTITRAAETCNNSKPSVNSTEGVLYCEIAALADDFVDKRISISDGTLNNFVTVGFSRFAGSIIGEMFSGGVLQTSNFGATGVNKLNNNKFAMVWNSTNTKFYLNGSVTNDESISAPTGLNIVQFSAGDLALPMFAKIKGLAVYNEALSESQLMQLTGVTASSIYNNFVTRTASFTVEALNEVKKVIDNL